MLDSSIATSLYLIIEGRVIIMPATRNLKILGGTALAAVVIGGATYGFTAQELTIKQLENKQPIVEKVTVVATPTVVPTATPAAILRLETVKNKVILPTGLTKSVTPTTVTKK